MKRDRDLGATQKAALHLARRRRDSWKVDSVSFRPVEVDENYIGGIEGIKHASKKLNKGGDAVGKIAVIGMKKGARLLLRLFLLIKGLT